MITSRPPKARSVLFLVILTGCAAGDDAEPREWDSLPGVPLELVRPADVRVGSVEGAEAELLHEVMAPSLLPDGSIIVPMMFASEVRVFGSDGSFLRTLGGPGEGPGEFRSLGAAWSRGDTIEAWDGLAARVTRFLPEGDVVTVQLADAAGGRIRLDAFVGALSDGWLISAMESAGMGQRDEVSVRRFGMDGRQIGDAVALVSGMERYRTENWGGPTPLSPAARFAVVSTSSSDALYVAQTLAPEITMFDFRDDASRLVRWQPAQSWTPEDAFDRVRRALDDRGDASRQSGGIRYSRDWIDATSPPEEVPVFSDFLVDEEGFIWIRSYEPERDSAALGGNVGIGRSGPGGEWRIFTEEGDEVGSVEVPEGFEPYEVTSDKVVGIYFDELGVEFVHVYGLNRS